MKALQDLFFSYKEKDSRTAGQIVGNEALPYKILSRLFQENRVEALGKALEISNLESAFEAAHRLKNISTNFESQAAIQCKLYPSKAGSKQSCISDDTS